MTPARDSHKQIERKRASYTLNVASKFKESAASAYDLSVVVIAVVVATQTPFVFQTVSGRPQLVLVQLA